MRDEYLIGNPWCPKCVCYHPSGFDCEAARKRAVTILPTPTTPPVTLSEARLTRIRTIAANLSLRSFEDTPSTFAADLLHELLSHIDALTARIAEVERERDAGLPWVLFYRDGLDLTEIAEKLKAESVYAFSPWLYAPLLHQDRHSEALKVEQARALAAESALAEARGAALEEAAKVADNWVGAHSQIGPLHDAGMSLAGGKIASTIRSRILAAIRETERKK